MEQVARELSTRVIVIEKERELKETLKSKRYSWLY